MRGFGGEIVQVEGGHIVRSTGRKDRHSKVYTAKGPRDRRVRLSAHTAIQFYDVQDRLGYDRPSKAMDWLIQNAKPAIDKLAELPPLHPGADDSTSGKATVIKIGTAADSKGLKNIETSWFAPQQHQQLGSVSGSMMDMISRKDLGLSLDSFQVPEQQEQNGLFASSAGHVGGFEFEAGDNHRRSAANWNNDTENRDEFSFNHLPSQQPTTGLSGFEFLQRGTLQSSFSTALHQPFSFLGHLGSDGFPGFCISGQIHGEEGSNYFGLQRPPSS